MNDVWNLDPLYHGFDDPAYGADMEELKALAAAAVQLEQALATLEPLEGLRKGIGLQEKIAVVVNKLAGYASLRQAADTRDPEAGSQMGRIMAVYSEVAAPFAAFKDWAGKLPNLLELAGEDEVLRSSYSRISFAM